METYLYLSLIPESLIVSMLPPTEFGTYLAAGTKKRAKEQAIYFELKKDLVKEGFDLQKAFDLCVPHPDGQPKHTVYVSTYRVLERLPLDCLGSAWLATCDGRVLELTQATAPTEIQDKYHLYHELCPVHPLIASSLNPIEFCKFVTDPNVRISVPKICFADLKLEGLVEDPVSGKADNLPYSNIGHLRDCLAELTSKEKTTKTVDRIHLQHVCYRCMKSGLFVGDHDNVLYYPFPTMEEIEKNHYEWWRSATLS